MMLYARSKALEYRYDPLANETDCIRRISINSQRDIRQAGFPELAQAIGFMIELTGR